MISLTVSSAPEAHRLVENVVLETDGVNAVGKPPVGDDFVDDLANLLSRSVLKPLAVDALHGEALHVHAFQELLLNLLLDAAPEFAHRVWRRHFFVVASNGSIIDLLLDWRFDCGWLGGISRPVAIAADAQHRLADLHDHSAVERYGAIYLLTVYVCPVCTMEVRIRRES